FLFDCKKLLISSMTTKKSKIVQTKNPRTGKYVKIDRSKGKILTTKKSTGPFKGVPIIRKKSK
ncbi:MAG: hypothetical protein KAU83_00090, partial [Bacteroidales bacterium]|nr:hypothetical protein [Bacteroidales bacterium]